MLTYLRCTAAIVITLIFAHQIDPAAVAARCNGEASFGLAECVCTVKNRLDVGWAESRVLSAYYANDVAVTPAQVQIAADILNEVSTCNPNLYFMYSKQDTLYLKIDHIVPVLVLHNGAQEIHFYERWFRDR